MQSIRLLYYETMIQVIKRVFDILDHLHVRGALPLREIAAGVGLSRSTACNILRTLKAEGAVAQDSLGRYVIGERLSGYIPDCGTAIERVAPLAREVATRLSETVHEKVMAVCLDGHIARVLAAIEVSRSVVVAPGVLHSGPIYSWATGRLLLAHLSGEALATFIEDEGLPGTAWHEVTDRADLLCRLVAIREKGICERISSDGDMQSVAVPVPAPGLSLPLVLGVHLPRMRYTSKTRPRILRQLRAAAAELSAALTTA